MRFLLRLIAENSASNAEIISIRRSKYLKEYCLSWVIISSSKQRIRLFNVSKFSLISFLVCAICCRICGSVESFLQGGIFKSFTPLTCWRTKERDFGAFKVPISSFIKLMSSCRAGYSFVKLCF